MAVRRGAGAAPQHELVAHELAVIFADGAGGRLEAGIRQIGASRPLPHIAVHLLELVRVGIGRHGAQMTRAEGAPLDRKAARGHLPLEFGRQPLARPAGEGVHLVKAHMADGRAGSIGRKPCKLICMKPPSASSQ